MRYVVNERRSIEVHSTDVIWKLLHKVKGRCRPGAKAA